MKRNKNYTIISFSLTRSILTTRIKLETAWHCEFPSTKKSQSIITLSITKTIIQI